MRFAAHQGRERFFEARVGLLPPGGAFGPEALAIVQIEDRTETRRAEQLRSDFIANASHELRTPLASIIGYIETLQNHARERPGGARAVPRRSWRARPGGCSGWSTT